MLLPSCHFYIFFRFLHYIFLAVASLSSLSSFHLAYVCVCIFQEMVVLCLVPFVKACCLSQRTAVHPYFTSLLPTTNYPSPSCRAVYSSFAAARVGLPMQLAILGYALRYRHRLFQSFRTPVPVRLVCVFTVCSSSFIIHAPLLPGHLLP